LTGKNLFVFLNEEKYDESGKNIINESECDDYIKKFEIPYNKTYTVSLKDAYLHENSDGSYYRYPIKIDYYLKFDHNNGDVSLGSILISGMDYNNYATPVFSLSETYGINILDTSADGDIYLFNRFELKNDTDWVVKIDNSDYTLYKKVEISDDEKLILGIKIEFKNDKYFNDDKSDSFNVYEIYLTSDYLNKGNIVKYEIKRYLNSGGNEVIRSHYVLSM
jgi:hypothetical protein